MRLGVRSARRGIVLFGLLASCVEYSGLAAETEKFTCTTKVTVHFGQKVLVLCEQPSSGLLLSENCVTEKNSPECPALRIARTVASARRKTAKAG